MTSPFAACRELLAAEWAQFEHRFEEVLGTRVPLADNVVRYFLDRRGKQLRPMMTLLAARVVGGVPNEATVNAAVALELVHNASLIHDDVIDRSDERRGAATVNRIWDNRIAVLMGDFFLSKALLCSNATGSLCVSGILADMVTRLTEGELEQMSNVRSHMLSEERYLSVITGKTASLFAACMRAGAATVDAAPDVVERIAQVGEKMGLVFQIRDDIFDYYPATAELGKPTGHDIAEGKVTLPLLYALNNATPAEAQRMRALVDNPRAMDPDDVERLVAFAKAMGGIEYARARMKHLAHEAHLLLDAFPAGEARQALSRLTDYFVERDR